MNQKDSDHATGEYGGTALIGADICAVRTECPCLIFVPTEIEAHRFGDGIPDAGDEQGDKQVSDGFRRGPYPKANDPPSRYHRCNEPR